MVQVRRRWSSAVEFRRDASGWGRGLEKLSFDLMFRVEGSDLERSSSNLTIRLR